MSKNAKEIAKLVALCLALPVWVFLAVTAAEYIVSYPLYWGFGAKWLTSPLGSLICTALIYVVALGLVLLPQIFYKKLKTSRDELGLTDLPTWTDIGLAPIAYIAATIAAIAAVAIASALFPGFDVNETQQVGFQYYLSGGDRVLAFIALVVVAPIAEEIIFRGWLYGKLRSKTVMPVAIFIVSLLFGIVHGQWNVGINVFMMSIVLCGLREITGTVYAGILAHMIKNAVAFVLLFIMHIGV